MNLESKIRETLARHETDVQTRPGAWIDVERRVARSHKQRLAVQALVAVLAVAGAVVVIPRLGGQPKPAPFATEQPEPGTTTPPTLRAKISVPAFRLAATKDALWGLVRNERSGEPGQLVRMDPDTGDVVARIDVGLVPQSLAADEDAVWVTNASGCGDVVSCGDASHPPTFKFPQQRSLMKIDPRANRVVATIRLDEPQDVEIAFGSVWVSNVNDNGEAEVVRIDEGKISARIPHSTAGDFTNLSHDERYLWFLSPLEGNMLSVVRVDPRTNSSARPWNAGDGSIPPSIATGFGSIWVTASGTNSASGIQRYDTSGHLIAHITLPDASPVGLQSMTIGEGSVWAGSARGYFWKVDPETNRPVGDPIQIGDAPPAPATDIVTGFGSVWVCAGDGKIWRFAP